MCNLSSLVIWNHSHTPAMPELIFGATAGTSGRINFLNICVNFQKKLCNLFCYLHVLRKMLCYFPAMCVILWLSLSIFSVFSGIYFFCDLCFFWLPNVWRVKVLTNIMSELCIEGKGIEYQFKPAVHLHVLILSDSGEKCGIPAYVEGWRSTFLASDQHDPCHSSGCMPENHNSHFDQNWDNMLHLFQQRYPLRE